MKFSQSNRCISLLARSFAPPRTGRAGFTLVEILLVVAIIGILAGIAVVSTKGRIGDAQRSACRSSIKAICTAIDTYELDNGVLPNSIDDLMKKSNQMNWHGPYLKIDPTDPWGNKYNYARDGEDYKVSSAGPDSQAGSGDDITN